MAYGYLSHVNPLTFDPTDLTLSDNNGFALFLTQVCIIIILCTILGNAFKKIGQPVVLGELLAGVLLGPTAFSLIPGFTENILPKASLSLLKLFATIGLSLFLFLVGLETDTELMARNWKKVAIITLPGMSIPFAVSVGIARLIYIKQTEQTSEFTTFFLFIGTVMAVTSLSVLSRILAEYQILQTPLGSITVAAGVLNDLIGYVLLAIGSALASGGAPITALYELLTIAGFVAILWLVYRPLMRRALDRSGFDLNDPSAHPPNWSIVVGITGALISSFVSDSIGVHPIVGSFAFGVCSPHGFYAVKLTEAIETPVSIVLLPLYFVTSGLNTDFTLLDNGVTWGLIVLLLFGIFVSKFGVTTLSAKIAGMNWNEAMCVGALMQSKGIIEIIILNVGLEMGVVNRTIFSMLVLCFLCTTLSVKPLAKLVYFSKQDQAGAELFLPAESEKKGLQEDSDQTEDSFDYPITIALTSVNPSIRALMSFLKVVGGGEKYKQGHEESKQNGILAVDLIRLLPTEFTTSSILRLINYSDGVRKDDLLDTLKLFAQLNQVSTSSSLSAERNLYHETQHEAANQFTQHHSVNPHLDSNVKPLPDTFPVPDEELVSFTSKCNERAQKRLKVPTSIADGTDLGRGMVVVSWENANMKVRNQSWLGAAAAASGLKSSGNEDEEDAYWRADADARELPNRVFRELKSATGVLVDGDQFNKMDPSLTTSLRPRFSQSERIRLEREIGLSPSDGGTQRKPRVFSIFFGGADDRACVELCRKISEGGAVDGIVVSVMDSEGLNSALAGQEAQAEPDAEKEVAQHKAEGENSETINLRTIHRGEAAARDARFLFSAQQPSSLAPPDIPTPRASSPNGEKDKTFNAQKVSGVYFITLNRQVSSKDRIQALVASIHPLLDEVSDILLIGRGKLGQRPKEFRQSLEAMYAEMNDLSLMEDIGNDVKTVGKTLGAATESILLSGIRAQMLVVQASRK